MKSLLLVLFVFSFQTLQAQNSEASDAEVHCSNIKGEVIQKAYYRIAKDSVKVFETTGGFAFYGQPIVIRTNRAGMLGLVHVPCGADLESDTDTSLVTCATGSQIRFLNKILPPISQGCR